MKLGEVSAWTISIGKGERAWVVAGMSRRSDEVMREGGKSCSVPKGATQEWDGWWHHGFNRHELEQTPGDGEVQGSLACCSPWGHEESGMTLRLNRGLEAETPWTCAVSPPVGNAYQAYFVTGPNSVFGNGKGEIFHFTDEYLLSTLVRYSNIFLGSSRVSVGNKEVWGQVRGVF